MTREKWAALSDEAKRIKVAELCVGGTPFGDGVGFKRCRCGQCTSKYARWHWSDGSITDEPPDYLNDLNACHDMERRHLSDVNLQARYIRWLLDISHDGWACFATAAQRCEAFVLTMEKS